MNKIRVLVGICSHYSGEERRQIIRDTWLKDEYPRQEIVCRFFVGGTDMPRDDRGDIVVLGSNDSYACLPSKCCDFYRWGDENFDFDYIFKCDDDTFLAIDRLLDILDDEYDLVGDESTKKPGRMAPSGGAGYFLSRPLVKALLKSEVPSEGYEDLIFGNLARSLGFKCKSEPRLCMHAGKPPLPENNQVSSHWCSKEQMRLFHQMYLNPPLWVFQAVHPHWKSELKLYAEGVICKEQDGALALLRNHGKGLLSIDWQEWEKELIRQVSPGLFVGENLQLRCKKRIKLDAFLPPLDDAFTEPPKVALCISSYKRLEHLERQIFSMLHQDYPFKHVFVAVKGISEYIYRSVLIPVFQKFMDAGELTLRYFPNKNQLSNFVDTVRDIDREEYDLFFKIDDDDYYSPFYVSDCCAFHQTIPRSWSSYLDDVDMNLEEVGGYLGIAYRSYSAMFGFSMVLSKAAMEFIVECDRNPMDMHAVSARWDKGEGHHFYGFTEDHFFHNVMKELGGLNRSAYNKENNITFHILVNKMNPSMTRGRGTLMEDFKHVNGEVCNSPERWEHILDVRHPYWEAPFRLFMGKGERLDIQDPFEVLLFDGCALVVKWKNYGEERFLKQENGLFVYVES